MNWEIISPDLTTNDPEKQRQQETGGLNYDNSGAEMHTTITVVEPSSLQAGLIWVGTDDGNVQLTRNGGDEWINSASKFSDLPDNAWVQQIKASTYDAGTAFVVFDDHRRDNWTPYVYQTTNYGRSWKRIVDEDDVFGFALSIVQDPVEPNLLFPGTETGLYVSMDGAETWAKWIHGYPTVPTMDLAIHPREHDLIIGTFGRSIWILDDIRPIREATQQGVKQLQAKDLHLFEIPDATNAIVGPYMGYRSTGHGMFLGENKPFSAAMIFYASSKDKVKMEIMNTNGVVVRTKFINPDRGLNRVYWGFESDGVRFPGRRKTEEGQTPPGGYDVLPGSYTVRMTQGEVTTEQNINVLADQRVELDMTALAIQQDFIADAYAAIEEVTGVVDQIREAQEIVKKVSALDEENEELQERSKAITDQLEALDQLFFEPPVQGFKSDPNVISAKLGNLRGKMGGSHDPVSQGATYALKNFRDSWTPVNTQVEAFFNNDWKAYQDFVNGLDLVLVKGF